MKPPYRIFVVLALGLSGLLSGALGGCSSAKPPTFRVSHVQMRERTAEGTELLFVIEAANPNANEIPLHEANYRVSLGGGEVFHAIRTPEATLRRYSTQTFTLPVAVPADQMPPGDHVPYAFNATITYILPGALAEILFDRELKKPKAAFGDSGTLDFTGAEPGTATIGAAIP